MAKSQIITLFSFPYIHILSIRLSLFMLISAPIRLHAEYSLAWCNTAVILLLSLLFTTQSFGTAVRKAAVSAQSDIAALCELVDATASSLANTPSALLHMLNNEAETSVMFVLNTTRHGLLAAIDGVDGLLEWFISIYKSTYVCLMTLAVDSSVDVITSVSNTFEATVQSILSGSGIDSVAHSIGNAIIGNDTSQNGDVSWPNITSNWTTALIGLDTKIHNWTLGNSVDTILSIPLQDLKIAVNQSLWQSMVQASNFTDAAQNMSKISLVPCNATVLQQDIEDITAKLLGVARAFTFIFIALMIIVSLVNVFCRYIVNNWRLSMAQSFVSTSDRLNHAHAMLILRAGHKPFMWYIMSLLGISPLRPRRSVSLSWLVDYISQPAALFALAYGLSGIIFTSLAIKLVEDIRDDAIDAFTTAVDDLIGDTVHNLSYALVDVATSVVNNTNAAIDTLEYGVNQDALGWVNITAYILNSTLNQVSSDVTGVMSDIFGGTVLENAAQALVNCLLLNKIQSIEQGLTWLVSESRPCNFCQQVTFYQVAVC